MMLRSCDRANKQRVHGHGVGCGTLTWVSFLLPGCSPARESPQALTTVDPDFNGQLDHIYYKSVPALALGSAPRARPEMRNAVFRMFPDPADRDRVERLWYPNRHIPSDHALVGARLNLAGCVCITLLPAAAAAGRTL